MYFRTRFAPYRHAFVVECASFPVQGWHPLTDHPSPEGARAHLASIVQPHDSMPDADAAAIYRPIVNRIRDAVWPDGNPDHPWSADTTDTIARILLEAGIGPTPAPAPRLPSEHGEVWHVGKKEDTRVAINDENGLRVALALPKDAPLIAAAPALAKLVRDAIHGRMSTDEAARVLGEAFTGENEEG